MRKSIADLFALAAIAACGGARSNEGAPALAATQAVPAASAPTAPADSSAPAPPPTPPASAAETTPPPSASLAAVLMTDSSAIQKLFEDVSRAPAAKLVKSGVTLDDPLAKSLRDLAKKAAPNMVPDGPLAAASLKEKESAQTDVTLEPGKCYVIVGHSKRVRDLDLYLLLSPGILSGQDMTDDNSPVIGGPAPAQPMCPAATTPVTYKLAIVADQGAGEVVVQLYSRTK